jgi:hypothetical protein
MTHTRRPRRLAAYDSIRQFLDHTGTRQVDLAADLGISQPYMSLIISGARMPNARLAVALSEATRVPVAAIVRHCA